jgi:hypothetical protein
MPDTKILAESTLEASEGTQTVPVTTPTENDTINEKLDAILNILNAMQKEDSNDES